MIRLELSEEQEPAPPLNSALGVKADSSTQEPGSLLTYTGSDSTPLIGGTDLCCNCSNYRVLTCTRIKVSSKTVSRSRSRTEQKPMLDMKTLCPRDGGVRAEHHALIFFLVFYVRFVVL